MLLAIRLTQPMLNGSNELVAASGLYCASCCEASASSDAGTAGGHINAGAPQGVRYSRVCSDMKELA